MDLESKKTFESKTTPEVRFTLRRLNQRQRAKRDLLIAQEKLEYGDLCEQFVSISKEWKGKESERTPEVLSELRKLDYRIGLLLNAFIKPATIKAALLKIEGATLDGRAYTPESFCDSCDNDALIDEVWIEAERLSGLTVEQSEGFSSPSPSDEAAAGTTTNTTAMNVDGGDTTVASPAEQAETAACTSPSA